MKNLYRWAEATDQGPIFISIFYEGLLPLLKELKDTVGRIGEFKLVGERIVSEIDTGFLGIVNKGIEDQLEGRRRNGRLRRRRHETNRDSARSGDRCEVGVGEQRFQDRY
jgi:hypothetical protein